MALKVKLKPEETIFIGTAVLQNSTEGSVTLLVKNQVPVLRAKDILKEEDATTPVTKLYFLIQLIYMFGFEKKRLDLVAQQIREIGKLGPDFLAAAVDAGTAVLEGDCYGALKIARPLIDEELEYFKKMR